MSHLFRVLDYAYLFFSLVILSALLWAGAGLVVIWAPLVFLLGWFFPFSSQFILLSALYTACLSGSIGFFWGVRRWRKHLQDEASKARRPKVEKPPPPPLLGSE